MIAFERLAGSRLYIDQANQAGAGWWAWLLAAGAQAPAGPVPLTEALENAELGGSFVYCAVEPDLGGDKAAAFVAALDAILATVIGGRALLWLRRADQAQQALEQGWILSFSASGGGWRTSNGLDLSLTGGAGIGVAIASGAALTVAESGDALILTGRNSAAATLSGGMAPALYQDDYSATLAFAGAALGSWRFGFKTARLALARNFACGFQLLVPNPAANSAGSDQPVKDLSAYLPLVNGGEPNPTDLFAFTAQFNPVNPNNILSATPTVFWFSAGASLDLVSYYRTVYGMTVALRPVLDAAAGRPAGLVVNPGSGRTPLYLGYSFAPVGDFELRVVGAEDGQPQQLLAGLSGSENIGFVSGAAYLRASGGQPAYAPVFPLEPSSPVGPPLDPLALLLNRDFRTSWCTVTAKGEGASAHYAAAPKGADLFGLPDAAKADGGDLLEPKDPGLALPNSGELSFPLLPFAAFRSGAGDQDLQAGQMELLESQIVSPTRRNRINAASAQASRSARASLGLDLARNVAGYNAATPAGFIARVAERGWSRLLLAQIMAGGQPQWQLGFTAPSSALQAAFQTDNLFLPVANPLQLGVEASGVMPEDPPASASRFYNQLEIDRWCFKAAVGKGNRYGDYRNVMVVKGVPGSLLELVTRPTQWTQKNLFAAPLGPEGLPDASQLTPLADWLSEYFDSALKQQDNPYFQNFCRIIRDPNWQGVLLLRVDIEKVPAELLGLLAGVTQPEAFAAHHIGVELSQIDGKTVTQSDSSSLFGLIYYLDPDYEDEPQAHAIPPQDADATYEFRLLTLKALFQNTAVQRFESVAQVVLNQLFGSRVDSMVEDQGQANIYNAVLLQGGFQTNGGAPVYSLSSAQPALFKLRNNVLTSVEIATAALSTRDESAGGSAVSWLDMSGFMQFAVLKDEAGELPPFDLFSFGADGDEPVAGQGLRFSGLGLRIAFPLSGPDGGPSVISMLENELSFNPAASRSRAQGLYRDFQLELNGLLSGAADSTPAAKGFLAVATSYGLQGVAERAWHGLSLRVNLGTLGALASKVNLNTTLLLAWADDSGAADGDAGYQAHVGMALPGAGPGGELFSLQTVIKLSIGAIRLLYNAEQKGYLLLLNEIALKFLGLLRIPPNGATSFFLFGNPDAETPTGLGWYAIYNQDQPPPAAAPDADPTALTHQSQS
ncbi:hypothetical protein [Chromobacterium haemolyticum]|uniref:hypothetical protein n=1 Tax=Chromobacterium haemolyticum TaxID=394935 RepID=UPI0024477CFC|nr:hypothetical protein [Chromobacterium haemolyticum]MDH0343149.1 hypothetical protein [Chromobacterium haemolyticum]